MRHPRSTKSVGGALIALVVGAAVLALSSGAGQAARDNGITVGRSYHNDVSKPLRSITPVPIAPRKGPQPERNPRLGRTPTGAPDTVVDRTPAAPNMPAPMLNFDGIPYPGVACNCAPPDTNGEVGLSQYVQMVNEGFQVFDKQTGASLLGPLGITTLWQGFGGLCEFNGFGDPVVVYDQLANRWVITQFAGTTTITDQCIAVSTSADATGSYNRYGFSMVPSTEFYDYPKFGVWPDAYYASANIFNSAGTTFLGAQAYAFNRSAMLAGNPATFIAAPRLAPTENALLPADLDGLNPPPAGAPNPFLAGGDVPTWELFRFHVDFANPMSSTWTLANTLLPAAYTVLCPTTRSCIPQAGTTARVDGIGDRVMFRSAYRNFGDHEALVGNMSVCVDQTPCTTPTTGRAGVRWFELSNATSGTASFVQESTYAPNDGVSRWMGSAAMDGNGNLVVGYSASSGTIVPGIRYAGRLATDPPNDLSQGEATLFAGVGSQTGTSSRWGDYSDLTVDPVDDCTFWYTNEYYPAGVTSFNWRTRIGNFRFAECVAAPSGTLQGTVTDASNNSPISGAQIAISNGASTTTDASGTYSIVLPPGTYNVTASKFGYQSQTANNVTVSDGQTTTQDFALTPAPSGTLSGFVRDDAGNPLANATVTILSTPIPPATTDASGHYSFASAPNGEYDVQAQAGRCNDPQTQHVTVSGDTTLDFSLAARMDAFGYHCRLETPAYIEGTTPLALTGDDVSVTVPLPFPFIFYGNAYSTAFVSSNGHMNFLAANTSLSNVAIPNTAAPNAAIYPFWDDLFLDASSSAWTDTLGTAPNRRFLIEWRNVRFFGDTTRRLDLEVILHEKSGEILTQYRNVADDGRERGNSATLGIENESGTIALQYSFNEAVLNVGETAIRYIPPPPYRVALNAGNGPYTDVNGDEWLADVAYSAALGYGYVQSPPKTTSTKAAIAGTDDDTLYQSARRSDMSYRFTGLDNGVYTLTLKFAEIQNKKPGQRQFDVIVNGSPYLIAFDIAAQAGTNTALDKVLTTNVTGGEVNVQFATRRSTGEPILNAIELTGPPQH